MTALPILALLLAITATVLAFIFITPAKKRANLNGFGKFLHDTLNFKFLIIEKILQALYIFMTAYTILLGFFMLFMVVDNYYSTTWYGGYGLLTMIVGPIAVRLAFEAAMMFILLIKNVIQINNKMKDDGSANTEDMFATPEIPTITPSKPEAETSTAASFCTNCGSKVEGGSFCTKCGTKID